jgi:hypothetical protein
MSERQAFGIEVGPSPRPFEVPVTAEAVVQADAFGMTVAFTRVVVDGEIDAWLDTCRRAISRQRAHHELLEALSDLAAVQETMRSGPALERGLVKARADEQVRMRASWEAAHNTAGARTEFRLTPKYRQALEEFEAETARQVAKLAAAREAAVAKVPNFEARVARSRALIAGAERSEVIGEGPRLIAAE